MGRIAVFKASDVTIGKAELEAIPANDLRQIVRTAIESHIPTGAWERLQGIERLEKEHWERAMQAFTKAT